MELIKEDIFRKQLKKGLSGGFLFFGDEDYLKSFALHAAREEICPDPTFALFNDVRIDAMDYSAGALLDALMPPPMMADKKIVTVSGLNLSAMRSPDLDALCEALSALKEYEYNVLILSVPAGQFDEGYLPKKPSALYTRLSEYLTPVSFAPISGAKLVAWVAKHFGHHGVTASPEVCSYLIEYSGKSMFTLSAETEKLSYYVLSYGRNTVTREDVETVCVAELDTDTFALTNAILDGNGERAFHALEVMRFRRMDPILVLGQISKAISDLYAIHSLQKEGLGSVEIAAILKPARISEYQARLYMGAAASKSEKRLRRALMLCSEADKMLKQSPQGYQAIERFIGSL